MNIQIWYRIVCLICGETNWVYIEDIPYDTDESKENPDSFRCWKCAYIFSFDPNDEVFNIAVGKAMTESLTATEFLTAELEEKARLIAKIVRLEAKNRKLQAEIERLTDAIKNLQGGDDSKEDIYET